MGDVHGFKSMFPYKPKSKKQKVNMQEEVDWHIELLGKEQQDLVTWPRNVGLWSKGSNTAFF